jgi:hypothetical protein
MDLTSLDTNKDVTWDESLEKIFSELGDEAQINAYLHKKASEYYVIQNIKYQLPIIILSALSGSGNFISANFPAYSNMLILGIGGVSIFTSIISSVAQFLKVSQLGESHRISYLSWEKFHSTIKFQLNRRKESRDNIRDFLSLVIPEYQRLKEISADIPQHIMENVKRDKKKLGKMQIPYMLNGFHPVTSWKDPEPDTDSDEDNGNGLITLETLDSGDTFGVSSV